MWHLHLERTMAQPETEVRQMAEGYAAERPIRGLFQLICYDPNSGKSLETWLKEFPPSQVTRGEGNGSIRIDSLHRNVEEKPESNHDGLHDSFKDLISSDQPISHTIIRELAQRYHILGGSWKLFARTGLKVDHFGQL